MKDLFTANGHALKPIGFGSYPLQGQEMMIMVMQAFQMGCFLIDTADDYRGETGIGLAVKKLHEIGLKREDIFIQTKISDNSSYNDDYLETLYFNQYSDFMKIHTVEEIVREKVHISLREMHTDYLDSLLIHLPYEHYSLDIWEAMIKLQKEGKVRYLGVSNYHERHIEELKQTGVIPSINEIYISPIGIKQEQVEYAKNNDIVIMTYSPLMDLAGGRISQDVLRPIAEKYNKTIAQIILRWNIDRGCFPLPKTKNVKRLKENIDVFDFQLTEQEIAVISAQNRDYQFLVESKICPGI